MAWNFLRQQIGSGRPARYLWAPIGLVGLVLLLVLGLVFGIIRWPWGEETAPPPATVEYRAPLAADTAGLGAASGADTAARVQPGAGAYHVPYASAGTPSAQQPAAVPYKPVPVQTVKVAFDPAEDFFSAYMTILLAQKMGLAREGRADLVWPKDALVRETVIEGPQIKTKVGIYVVPADEKDWRLLIIESRGRPNLVYTLKFKEFPDHFLLKELSIY